MTLQRCSLGLRYLVCGLFFLLAVDSALVAAELSGELRLVRRGRPVRGDLSTGLVVFTPHRSASVEAPERPFEMVTVDKNFEPRVLAVPVGATVRFPNSDPILHNVFSVSGENAFDLGLYKQGPGKAATFHHPGLVRVFCNVHHDMIAYIRVVETPYVVRPDSKGRFRLRNLPEGGGTLTVWHERTNDETIEIAAGQSSVGTVEITATRPRVPQHTNKVGKPYRRSGRRNYR